MPDDSDFRQLMERVRAGDSEAAAALVRQCEDDVRRFVRSRLTDPRLRRTLDSMDICQSVLGRFFVRATAGQFNLDTPEQLLRLLVTMAQNEVKEQARKQHAQRRDNRRVQAGNSEVLDAVADDAPSPSRVASGRELLERLHEQMAPDERYLAEQRAQGREWSELARELGASPEALRKKLSRALDRAKQQLGLKDATEE